MDMSPSFKAAVRSALGNPVIVADRFHFLSLYLLGDLIEFAGVFSSSFTTMTVKSAKEKGTFFINLKTL